MNEHEFQTMEDDAEEQAAIEHGAGEHADFVDMDCPRCLPEWESLTAGQQSTLQSAADSFDVDAC